MRGGIPTNTQWSVLLSQLHTQIGIVQQQKQGDLTGAQKSFEKARSVTEHLLKLDPSNARWSLLLSASYTMIGVVQQKQGDLTDALKSYNAAQSLTERLVKADPTNTQWSMHLGISQLQIGLVRLWQGNLTGALKHFKVALSMVPRLTRRTSVSGSFAPSGKRPLEDFVRNQTRDSGTWAHRANSWSLNRRGRTVRARALYPTQRT